MLSMGLGSQRAAAAPRWLAPQHRAAAAAAAGQRCSPHISLLQHTGPRQAALPQQLQRRPLASGNSQWKRRSTVVPAATAAGAAAAPPAPQQHAAPLELPGDDEPVLAGDATYRPPAPLPEPPASGTLGQVCGRASCSAARTCRGLPASPPCFLPPRFLSCWGDTGWSPYQRTPPSAGAAVPAASGVWRGAAELAAGRRARPAGHVSRRRRRFCCPLVPVGAPPSCCCCPLVPVGLSRASPDGHLAPACCNWCSFRWWPPWGCLSTCTTLCPSCPPAGPRPLAWPPPSTSSAQSTP